jgi:hemolysin type calcium-binding protein
MILTQHRRRDLVAAAALAVTLALPAPALATTVSRSTVEGIGDFVGISDTAGVADGLVASGATTGGVTVTSVGREGGAPITAGPGCTQTSSTVVSCPSAPLLLATLAGGADSLIDRTNLSESFDGGAGADRLTAGTGGGSIRGGTGNDILRNAETAAADGIARALTLRGDDGNDTLDLSGNRSGRDTAHGGAGLDTATYARRLDAAVEVALDDIANDGGLPPLTLPGQPQQPGEQDDVRSDVENVEGGGRSDFLTGSAGSNQLSGNAGNDTIRGLAGSDALLGGAGNDVERGGDGGDKVGALTASDALAQDPGRDTLLGEGGFDILHAADGESDARIDCGPGETEIGELATIDLPDPEPIACEVVQRGFRDQHPLVQVRPASGRIEAGSVAVRLACPAAAPGRRCAGTVKVVRKGQTLARGRYRIRKGRRATLNLPLSGGARGRAQVLTRERDTEGRPETTRTRIRLRG